jgi:hypothetical protein
MNYAGQYDAQNLTTWTSEWGGGSLPKPQHGSALITPGMAVRMTPGGAYDTFYQLQRMAPMPWAKEVTYHTSFKVADADLPACQAVEDEIFKSDGQLVFDGGIQFDFRKTKTFNTYDFAAGRWIPTNIPADISMLTGGKLLDAVVVYDLTPTTITWRGLQLNGLWIALGITRPGVHKEVEPCLNYATQWDFTAQQHVATMVNPGIDIVIT